MRLCVIGDSHLASLKHSWQGGLSEEFDSVQVTFFGSGNDSMKFLDAAGDKLVATDERLGKSFRMTLGLEQAEIRLAEYDGVLIHGHYRGGVALGNYFFLLGAEKRSDGCFSLGFRRRFVESQVTDGLLGRTLGLIRQISHIPVVVAPQPYLSENLLNLGESHPFASFVRQMEYFDEDQLQWHHGVINEAVRRNGAELLMQNEETICRSCFTKHEYSTGSVALASDLKQAHSDEDVVHMNARFGALLMRNAIGRLQALIASGS